MNSGIFHLRFLRLMIQDRVPAFSPSKAKSFIETELGAPISMLYKEFEDLPIAAASLGQVFALCFPLSSLKWHARFMSVRMTNMMWLCVVKKQTMHIDVAYSVLLQLHSSRTTYLESQENHILLCHVRVEKFTPFTCHAECRFGILLGTQGYLA